MENIVLKRNSFWMKKCRIIWRIYLFDLGIGLAVIRNDNLDLILIHFRGKKFEMFSFQI